MKSCQSLAAAPGASLPESLDLAGPGRASRSRGNPRFAPSLPLRLNFLRPRPRDMVLTLSAAPARRKERPGAVQILAYFLSPEESGGPARGLPPLIQRNLAVLGPAKVLFWLAATVALGLAISPLG